MDLDETIDQDVAPVEPGGDEQPVDSGGNPAWEPIREKLDPISFRQIEPELSKWESEAKQRIQSLNSQYKPWKAIADSGHTPETIGQWQVLVDRLNTEPEVIYQELGRFLRENGRMPSEEELSDAVEDAEDSSGDVPEKSKPDPQIAALQQQNQQMIAFLENQERERTVAAAEADLDRQMAAFKEAHPDYSTAEIREVLRRAAYTAQTSGKVPTLEEANAEYVAFKTELLTAQRPGDSAPRLLPTGGGVPSGGGQQRKLGDLSRQEIQDLTASIFAQRQGG